MAKKKLYKTADEIIAAYSLTSSKVHRKVYLAGRPLKTGNVALVRYHSSAVENSVCESAKQLE